MHRSALSIFILSWIVFTLVGWGCAFVPKTGFKPKEEKPPEQKEEVEQIEDFDPLSLDDDDISITEPTEPTRSQEREEEIPPVVVPETEEAKEIEQVQGYRVQIFVSSSMESAQNIMAEADKIFPNEVYLQYDAPYYKVRVGNCLTRREGDLLRERAIRRGYRDAWVVRSLVAPANE